MLTAKNDRRIIRLCLMAACLLALTALPAMADQEMIACSYAEPVAGAPELTFIMLSEWDSGSFPQRRSGLYRRNQPDTPLWTVNEWMPQVGLFVEGGNVYLLSFPVWNRGGPSPDAFALAFYRDGTLLREYTVGELNPTHYRETISHFMWQDGCAFDTVSGIVTLDTYNNKRYRFDIRTGNIVEVEEHQSARRVDPYCQQPLPETTLETGLRWLREDREICGGAIAVAGLFLLLVFLIYRRRRKAKADSLLAARLRAHMQKYRREYAGFALMMAVMGAFLLAFALAEDRQVLLWIVFIGMLTMSVFDRILPRLKLSRRQIIPPGGLFTFYMPGMLITMLDLMAGSYWTAGVTVAAGIITVPLYLRRRAEWFAKGGPRARVFNALFYGCTVSMIPVGIVGFGWWAYQALGPQPQPEGLFRTIAPPTVEAQARTSELHARLAEIGHQVRNDTVFENCEEESIPLAVLRARHADWQDTYADIMQRMTVPGYALPERDIDRSANDGFHYVHHLLTTKMRVLIADGRIDAANEQALQCFALAEAMRAGADKYNQMLYAYSIDDAGMEAARRWLAAARHGDHTRLREVLERMMAKSDSVADHAALLHDRDDYRLYAHLTDSSAEWAEGVPDLSAKATQLLLFDPVRVEIEYERQLHAIRRLLALPFPEAVAEYQRLERQEEERGDRVFTAGFWDMPTNMLFNLFRMDRITFSFSPLRQRELLRGKARALLLALALRDGAPATQARQPEYRNPLTGTPLTVDTARREVQLVFPDMPKLFPPRCYAEPWRVTWQ